MDVFSRSAVPRSSLIWILISTVFHFALATENEHVETAETPDHYCRLEIAQYTPTAHWTGTNSVLWLDVTATTHDASVIDAKIDWITVSIGGNVIQVRPPQESDDAFPNSPLLGPHAMRYDIFLDSTWFANGDTPISVYAQGSFQYSDNNRIEIVSLTAPWTRNTYNQFIAFNTNFRDPIAPPGSPYIPGKTWRQVAALAVPDAVTKLTAVNHARVAPPNRQPHSAPWLVAPASVTGGNTPTKMSLASVLFAFTHGYPDHYFDSESGHVYHTTDAGHANTWSVTDSAADRLPDLPMWFAFHYACSTGAEAGDWAAAYKGPAAYGPVLLSFAAPVWSMLKAGDTSEDLEVEEGDGTVMSTPLSDHAKNLLSLLVSGVQIEDARLLAYNAYPPRQYLSTEVVNGVKIHHFGVLELLLMGSESRRLTTCEKAYGLDIEDPNWITTPAKRYASHYIGGSPHAN